MTNIHLIVHLGDGCVIVGNLISFEQNIPVPPVFDDTIHQLPEPSCRVTVLTDTIGTIVFNARHIVKMGTDEDSMVDIKAPLDAVLYLTSLLDLTNQEHDTHKIKRSIKERYKKISDSQWFKDAYEGKSIGEIMEIEGDFR